MLSLKPREQAQTSILETEHTQLDQEYANREHEYPFHSYDLQQQ